MKQKMKQNLEVKELKYLSKTEDHSRDKKLQSPHWSNKLKYRKNGAYHQNF